jgi:glyoxylase-like metal-dependent hydrolase (beta-lactamase superfamily II)
MRVRLVFGHNPGPWTGAGSNTWLVGGAVPTLIDAGSGERAHVDELAATLEGTGEARLAQVLVTHGHIDHAGGAAAIAVRWPEARFAKMPWAERDGRFPVSWHPLEPDQLVDAGDTQLWVVHTPGHSPDHVCFFEPRGGVLFAGDLVMTGGTVVIPASHGGDLARYLDSLRRVLELQPRRILAGHGPVIEQPAALLRGYIAHRLARERQIIDALTQHGPVSIPALVSLVYAELKPELHGVAAENVLAHLRKLESESSAHPDEPGDVLAVRWRFTAKPRAAKPRAAKPPD